MVDRLDGIGQLIIFHFLSTFIARVRPPTQIWIIVNIPGFPSGHAVAVVTCYGLLAYLLAPKIPSLCSEKIAVYAAALLIILFVGFSRIFTGGPLPDRYPCRICSGDRLVSPWPIR